MSLVLPVTEIHLWQVATDCPISEAGERQLLAELSSDERERHARFHFERDRRQYLLAHALLRRTLSCYAAQPPQSWSFVTNPFGKPALAGEGPHFNLSHGEGMVVCALANGARLGVDVERQDRRVDWDRLADRWLAPEERDWLASQPEAARATNFMRLWTLKEAYAKAVGRGLSVSLTAFAIGVAADGLVSLQRQDATIEVASDGPVVPGAAAVMSGSKPDDDHDASPSAIHCQLEHWQLDAHWLGLVAILKPGEARRTVLRRDGAPLLTVV